MKYLMLAVFDSAIQAYGRPIFAQTNGQAARSFTDEVNRPGEDNQYYKHPEDYELHYIGVFDDATGAVESNLPSCVLRGKDCKQ
ncbi:MAG: nonstructural protein [Microviridae sp.]|nr:MAG: nonstructural protein [Microviridae sp.]